MAQWYYYDEKGEKQGPVRGRELKRLVEQGTVTPETRIENSEGRIALAKYVTGLPFPEKANSMESKAENWEESDAMRLRDNFDQTQKQEQSGTSSAVAAPPIGEDESVTTAVPSHPIPLYPLAETLFSQTALPPAGQVLCTNCGTPMAAQRVVCTFCGTKVVRKKPKFTWNPFALNWGFQKIHDSVRLVTVALTALLLFTVIWNYYLKDFLEKDKWTGWREIKETYVSFQEHVMSFWKRKDITAQDNAANVDWKLDEAVKMSLRKKSSGIPLEITDVSVHWTNRNADSASGKFNAKFRTTERIYKWLEKKAALERLMLSRLYKEPPQRIGRHRRIL